MLSNAGVAFGLNVAAVFVIGAVGGLVLTLAGVFKVITLTLNLVEVLIDVFIGCSPDYLKCHLLWQYNYGHTDIWWVHGVRLMS